MTDWLAALAALGLLGLAAHRLAVVLDESACWTSC